MATKKAKYPQQLFVAREFEANGPDSWLNANESAGYYAETGETVDVAVYEFVRMVKVTAEVKVI